MSIGSIAATLAGVFGWGKVQSRRNNGGLTPSGTAIVQAIKDEGMESKTRHEDSMEILREVRSQQVTDEAWRKGFEAAKR